MTTDFNYMKCIECNEPIELGSVEDDIYVEGDGPFCPRCYREFGQGLEDNWL